MTGGGAVGFRRCLPAVIVLGGCLMSVDDNAWKRRELADGGLGEAPSDWGSAPSDAQSPLRNDPCGAAVDQCAVGTLRCSDGGVQTCGKGDASCAQWGPALPCEAGAACSGGSCVAQCTDRCEADTAQCDGDAVQTCTVAPSGCTEWGGAVPCAADQICAAGQCVCAVDCVPGATSCAEGGLQTCSATASGCPQWDAPVVCGAGQSCTGDRCVTHCSAEGLVSSCDPIAPSGCALGQCYLLSTKGPSCLCPVGTAASGSACNTTAECAPAWVCVGSQAPGVCRRLCDPTASQCPAGSDCVPIDAFAGYGFCR